MSTAVASIAENTGGGLYAYRCSKAGLNMSMKVFPQSWLAKQLHLPAEPICGSGWHGCSCNGNAPGLGSHGDGRTKCTGWQLKNHIQLSKKIMGHWSSNPNQYLQISTETCCSTMIQTLEGLTEKVSLPWIILSLATIKALQLDTGFVD